MRINRRRMRVIDRSRMCLIVYRVEIIVYKNRVDNNYKWI